MVIQGSYCDSDGVPRYMQDAPEEDSPEKICDRREVEDFPILVGMYEGMKSMPSSSGGINIEMECKEILSEGEDTRLEDDRAAIERETVNRVAKMAYASNKDEREELIALILKMMEMQDFLRKKDISWVEMEEKSQKEKTDFNGGLKDAYCVTKDRDDNGLPFLKKTVTNDGSSAKSDTVFIVGRDELGLPIFRNNFLDKDAGTSGAKDSKGNYKDKAHVMEEKTPKTAYGPGETTRPEKRKAVDSWINEKEPGSASTATMNKSWSKFVKEQPPISFEYFPLKEGESVISPPDEELIQGNAKFKNCMVGTFTKYVAPFNTVAEFAKRMWGDRGLCGVAQKSNTTYLFKFSNKITTIEALSKGTWYVGKKPMVVTPWGSLGSSDKIKKIPLWVKISNIPDSYWTNKGLSRLASVVGPPLCADQLTSKMKVLPFAKFRVNYDLGSPLPNSVKVVSLDPVTSEKITSEVQFSYPNKPLMCTGCNSLGHTLGACPRVIRT